MCLASECDLEGGERIPERIISERVNNSPGAKCFFEDLLHPLVRKLLLYLKEATLHLQ